jgi:hypothetical protein
MPLAIAFAGVAVGLGLYFGLRERAAPVPARVAWGETPSALAPSVVPSSAAVDAPPPDALRVRATSAAVAALEATHARLAEACWRPSVERHAEPAELTFQVRFLFDASGTQTSFDVAEPEVEARRDVAACLRAQKVEARLAEPPGAVVGTQVALRFPQ